MSGLLVEMGSHSIFAQAGLRPRSSRALPVSGIIDVSHGTWPKDRVLMVAVDDIFGFHSPTHFYLSSLLPLLGQVWSAELLLRLDPLGVRLCKDALTY
jgi:hypothetical protein